MLEFARQNYLAFAGFIAVFIVAYWLARRYQRRRVTYAAIWERVARKLRPPAWKRLLRALLTWLLTLAFLGGAVLHAAGLGPPPEREAEPLMIFLVYDCTPSMRAQSRDERFLAQTRRLLAKQRAQAVIDKLAPSDRALLVRFEGGQPFAGRWLRQGDQVPQSPPTDMLQPDLEALAALLAGIGPPADVPARPRPQPLVIWLGDDPPTLPAGAAPERLARLAPAARWRALGALPLLIETFGEPVENEYLEQASFEAAPDGADYIGIVRARTSKGPANVAALEYPEPMAIMPEVRDEAMGELKLTRTLPSSFILDVGGHAWPSTANPTAFPFDDGVSAHFSPGGVQSIALCHPEGEPPNALLRDVLELLLPGRAWSTHAIAPGSARQVRADLVVLDRVVVKPDSARLVLAFSALPAGLGDVQPGRAARAGFFLSDRPRPGFDVPDPSLFAATLAAPLPEETSLTPLARHAEAGALIGHTRAGYDLLYVGFVPHESNFLFIPEGPLLLSRWLAEGLRRARPLLPPFMRMDESVEIQLPEPGTLTLRLFTGWNDVAAAREYRVETTLDGRARVGPFAQPGTWALEYDRGRGLGEVGVYWLDPREQALPVTPLTPLDLSRLGPTAREPSWVDWFPEVLLWIALGALLLEWLLWLLGVTE